MAADAAENAPAVKQALSLPGVALRRTVSVIVLAVRRLGWGVADQAVSSLTNFAVSLYIVKTLGAVQFGAFSLAYIAYGFALNASRGLSTDPLMVKYSGTSTRKWRRAVADSTGTSLMVGLVAGVVLLGAAAALGGTTRAAFSAMGLMMPVLMLQDGWRFSFFAHGCGFHAFLNDSIWAVTLIPALVMLKTTGHADVFWFTLAWGATAGIAAVAGILQAGVIPRITRAWDWLVRNRELGVRYLMEGTSGSLVMQVRGYGTAAILGLAAVGYVQASVTLMGPITILALGMGLVTMPEAARVLRRSPRQLPVFCVLVSIGMTLAGLAWGLLLLIMVPRGFGAWVLGPVWRPTYPLVFAQTLYVVAAGTAAGAGTGLHGLGAARRSLRVVLLGSVISAASAVAGAALGGPAGTIYGLALAGIIASLIAWHEFRKALGESDRIPRNTWLRSKHVAGAHRRK